jgi:general stress protein 26
MNIAEAIRKFQESCNRIAFLATCDGRHPRLRPMSPVAVEGNVIWMAAVSDSPKMAQITANPNVEVCYMDPEHKHLRLSGKAEICRDEPTKRRMWEGYPLMQKYFPLPEDPKYGLLRITVTEAVIMESLSLSYQTLSV